MRHNSVFSRAFLRPFSREVPEAVVWAHVDPDTHDLVVDAEVEGRVRWGFGELNRCLRSRSRFTWQILAAVSIDGGVVAKGIAQESGRQVREGMIAAILGPRL